MSALTETPTTLNNLLHDIGKDLNLEDVRYMKYLLQGHINKETLQHLESGAELTEVLKTRGLVSEKRLAFLRKLLVETKCLKLVNLLDNFKEKYTPGVSFGDRDEQDGNARRNTKRETMLRMIERLENEIVANEECEAELNIDVKQYEMQIQANNEKLVQEEEEIQKLKEKIKENEASIESFERKLETVRFFLKKQEVELDKLKQKLEKNKNSASIKTELKEKDTELEKGKKDEDDLISKHQKGLDDIRSIHVDIRHRTEGIIHLEDSIHDTLLQIRIIKHNIHKNQRMRMELQEKLDNTSIDLEETNRQKPLTPASRAQSRFKSYSRAETQNVEQSVEYKILDYSEMTEQESTVIGRKGKGISPPQFNLPVSVAINHSGHLHVADYGNGRIHVITTEGKVQKQPLNIGGKCRPCALAVSCRGDLVMTDSQIIRVFNKNGEFLRPILPVYSKNDRRPELCSIAFDNNCCIYTGDKANHRIQKFNFEGNFLHFIGGPEEINYPIGIAVTKHGDVIVSDYMKHRLRVFFRERTLESKIIGSKGIGVCKFAYPRGIALDHQENILVADSQNHRIQVVTIEGECLGSFGTVGDDLGSFNTPYDVAVDKHSNIIVADTKNHRLQVFSRLVPVYSIYDSNGNENMNGHSDERDEKENMNGHSDERNEKENMNGHSDERDHENENMNGNFGHEEERESGRVNVVENEEKIDDNQDVETNQGRLPDEEVHERREALISNEDGKVTSSSNDEENDRMKEGQETNNEELRNEGNSETKDSDEQMHINTQQKTPTNEESAEQKDNSANSETNGDLVVAPNEEKKEDTSADVLQQQSSPDKSENIS